ncbi:MAG: hypothetical protein JW715_12900 [Sedimentisphaerales bacterium]|nr:hypothetical protein [Sedimentisphaerales bacterium]
MQKSQVGRFLITASIVFVLLIVLSLFLALALQIKASAFFEIAWSWFLRLLGLTTIVFSVISLMAAGPLTLEPEKISKLIGLVLLGLLIIRVNWSLAIGLAGILIAMMVVACLRRSREIAESGK